MVAVMQLGLQMQILATASAAPAPAQFYAEATVDASVTAPRQSVFDPAKDVTRVHVQFCHHLDVGLDIGLKLTEDCVGFATKCACKRLFSMINASSLRRQFCRLS
eukprot:SAG31_NODE_208_length_20313_cov_6.143119_9_plen_105_part_00